MRVCFSKDLFKRQLAYLKESGIRVVTFSEAIRKLTSSDASGRFVVITIDDAFNSFFQNGFPLLKAFGYPATLFINTETVGSGDYINWQDMKYLVDHGVEIGNHTHSHGYFLNVDQESRYDVFYQELKEAQQIIREKLNIEPKVFAYPYGEYDSTMIRAVRNMGFIGAAAQNSGVISSYSNLYSLPRFPMTDFYGDMTKFKEKLAMSALPVIRTEPGTTIAPQNPPVLKFYLEKNEFDMGQMQCFIQGSQCNIETLDSSNLSFQIVASEKLTSRRHLYTITVPSRDNSQWFWFSHQWVFPEIK